MRVSIPLLSACPDPKERTIFSQAEVLTEFNRRHPNLEASIVEGPNLLFNFKTSLESRGLYRVKLRNAKKKPPPKNSRPATKKTARPKKGV
jgi:hypothetical protein